MPENHLKISIVRIAIFFLIIFFIYLTSPSVPLSPDTYATTILPFLWIHGSYSLDWLINTNDTVMQDMLLVRSQLDDSLIIYYPIGVSIITFPLFLFFYSIAATFGVNMDLLSSEFNKTRILYERFSAAMIAALAVTMMFFLLKKLLVKHSEVYIYTLVFALCTPVWSIGSVMLSQQIVVVMILILTLVILEQWGQIQYHTNIYMMGIGLCNGLLFTVRPTAIVFSLGSFLYILHYSKNYKKNLYYYFSALLIGATPGMMWNLIHFGHPLGGYVIFTRIMHSNIMLAIYTVPLLLISPYRGFCTFCPLMVLFPLALYHLRKHEKSHQVTLLIYSLVSCIAEFILQSFNSTWYGGFVYGPRYLLVCFPVFFPIVAIYINHIFLRTRGHMVNIIFLSFFLLLSFGIQAVGFYHIKVGEWDPDSIMNWMPQETRKLGIELYGEVKPLAIWRAMKANSLPGGT